MIKSFKHKGVERVFSTGSKAGIQAAHASKLGRLLTPLNRAKSPDDMNQPGWGLHEMEGKRKACWFIRVNGNWRLTFEFDGEDAILVDYEDYHQDVSLILTTEWRLSSSHGETGYDRYV